MKDLKNDVKIVLPFSSNEVNGIENLDSNQFHDRYQRVYNLINLRKKGNNIIMQEHLLHIYIFIILFILY